MKPVTCFWSGIAGLSSVLLLGNLFSTYDELRDGVVKVVGLIAALLFIAGAVNVVLFCAQRPSVTKAELMQPVLASLAVCGVAMGVLIFLMSLGGG
jgi:hypothetical protein